MKQVAIGKGKTAGYTQITGRIGAFQVGREALLLVGSEHDVTIQATFPAGSGTVFPETDVGVFDELQGVHSGIGALFFLNII
ncbi:MAG: hypothetical protein BWY72_02083 [Bacteroidetes bacterium ADurb.Bin416]|nr:MAG: hypothetical protein BWY72_02083 [Bacteroidetes bacterium ADurb.Bin416]